MALANTDVEIFSGSASQAFAAKMCRYLGIQLGKSSVITFTEGNTFVKVEKSVRDKDVYIVQTIGLNPNNEFMELLFWIDAFKRASASSITAIIPYFSYAKADKKDEPRVSIRARVCADCLEAAGVDRIITMDLHSPQLQGFFKKPVDHLSGLDILTKHIGSLNIENPVVVSPDAGYAKNARMFALHLGSPLAIGDKTRFGHDEVAHVYDIIGQVSGRNAIIVDDFTITCNTLINMAKVLKDNGALKVYACVSHLLLNQKAADNLMNSHITKLFATDTVEGGCLCDKIETVSVANLFARAVQIIHDRDSLEQLFI